jgi:hypothetical protein
MEIDLSIELKFFPFSLDFPGQVVAGIYFKTLNIQNNLKGLEIEGIATEKTWGWNPFQNIGRRWLQIH